MGIVVTTPTGHVGSNVTRLLLQAGARPRLLVRNPARLDEATRRHCDIRVGDLTDSGYVRESIAGADTVLWIDPTPHIVADPIDTSLRTARPLVDAAAARDVARVILLSSAGAEQRGGVGHIDALGGIEQNLDATGVDALFLRAGYYFTNLEFEVDDLAEGVLRTAFRPDHPMAWVDPRDIGAVIAARLLNPAWHGRVVQGVHGPQDLSFTEVSQILSRALGRAIRLETVTLDDTRQALRAAGLPESAVAGIAGMTAGSRDLALEPPRDAITTTPTTLDEWAYARLRPLLPA